MNNAQKRQLAEILYMQDEMTQAQIAEYIGTSEQNITRWKKQGKWDDMKAAKTITKDSIIRNYYDQILMVQKSAKQEGRAMTGKEVDALHKISASIKNLESEISLSVIIGVFKDYNKWLVSINPELATKNTEYQKKFIVGKTTES